MRTRVAPFLRVAPPLTGRRGSALVPVLIVTMILAGTACAFVDTLITERTAVVASTRRAQSNESVRSGLEVLLSWCDCRFHDGDRQGQMTAWKPRTVVESDRSDERNLVSWIAPATDDDGWPLQSSGIADESGRLNLNALPLARQDARRARQSLLQIDGMTPHIADAILDWIDADEEPREFGAETSYYSSLASPYRPANAPLQRIEDLLLVRGVTRKLLFGTDDPPEPRRRELTEGRPVKSLLAPGQPAPWVHLMTVHSAESNLRRDGRQKINVNRDDLASLFDELERELGPREAQFIVAYRLRGPAAQSEAVPAAKKPPEREQDEAAARKEAAEEKKRKALERLNRQHQEASAETLDGRPSTRGGLNLKYQAAFRVRSLIELIGVQVHIPIDNVDTVLDSPWSQEPSEAQQTVDSISERLTTEEGTSIVGRVNPLDASRPVLRSIPGMTTDLVNQILAARRRAPLDPRKARRNIGWLIEERILDFPSLRTLAGGMTIRGGNVHRAICLACFADGKHPAATEVAIDGTGPRASILWERPLREEELQKVLDGRSHLRNSPGLRGGD